MGDDRRAGSTGFEERSTSDMVGSVWSLLQDGNLEAAYWLSASRQAGGYDVPVAPDLIWTLIGGRLSDVPEVLLVYDLSALAITEQPEDSDAGLLLGLAAALVPSLTTPQSGMSSWLRVPGSMPGISPLVQAVETFAQHNVPLRSDMLLGAAGVEGREAAVTQAVQRATSWMTTVAPAQTSKYERATVVWRKLIAPKARF